MGLALALFLPRWRHLETAVLGRKLWTRALPSSRARLFVLLAFVLGANADVRYIYKLEFSFPVGSLAYSRILVRP